MNLVELIAKAAYDSSSKRLSRRDGYVRTRWSELYDNQKVPFIQDARDELTALEQAGYFVVKAPQIHAKNDTATSKDRPEA